MLIMKFNILLLKNRFKLWKNVIKVHVIDDGSIDNTESIVNLYASKYQYSRKYFRLKKNKI